MKSQKNLEFVNCNFCGSDSYSIRYVKDGFNYVQCNVCEMVYVNPRLSQHEIDQLYDENYFHGKGFDKSIEYQKEFEEKVQLVDLNDWDISTIKEFLKEKINPKLLDVGCGMGLFLWKAKQSGFEIEGLELSQYASEFVRSKNISVQTKSIYDAELKPNSFDAIVMKEVIEHLPDPMRAMQLVHETLKPGGVLFMTTGNYNCPERKLRGKDWFYFMPKGHIYIFSNKTMNAYLRKAGFQNIHVTNQGDLLMNFLLRNNIIESNKFEPEKNLKRTAFKIIRSTNHFISSGMRIFAVK